MKRAKPDAESDHFGAIWTLGRRSGGCYAFLKRAKPGAESDHFGAVWTQVRRLFRFLEACKTRCRKRPFRRGLDAGPEAVTLP